MSKRYGRDDANKLEWDVRCEMRRHHLCHLNLKLDMGASTCRGDDGWGSRQETEKSDKRVRASAGNKDER